MASFRKRRLSTIEASEVSSKQLGSNSDPFAFEEDPPVPASVTQQQLEVFLGGRRETLVSLAFCRGP